MGYSTFFLEQAGLPTTQAFNMSIAQYALGICGTVTSWVNIVSSDTDNELNIPLSRPSWDVSAEEDYIWLV